jgi:hypothetical protein
MPKTAFSAILKYYIRYPINFQGNFQDKFYLHAYQQCGQTENIIANK